MNKNFNLLISFFLLLTTIFIGLSCQSTPAELSVHDFKFDGSLGSAGAKIEILGRNHFKVSLGHAPNHPDWSNMLQFEITGNARGNTLRLDVEFQHEKPQYYFNHYFNSWSYDGEEWYPMQWKGYQATIRSSDVLIFPEFTENIVYVGHQVPLSYERLEKFINNWGKNPYVGKNILGKSIQGKNLYRLTLSDTSQSNKKWVHYFSNQHPGEHNAQWRMVGMINWLLSNDGAGYLKQNIHHFIFMMSPDAPSHGWYRVNAQGVDMNRSYRGQGSDMNEQTHEAYIYQKDLEDIMYSENPVTDIWSMHTWQGAVEPIMLAGPEIGSMVGDYTHLRDIILRNDLSILIEPLRLSKTNPQNNRRWTHGPHLQFGITAVLCEGAGNFYTKRENIESGVVLMKSIAEFYR